MTGSSPHGQGEETTFAQIAADELGVAIDDVLVRARRHRHRAVRHRHLRQPRHGGRRRGPVLRPPGAEGEDQEVRRDAAGYATTSRSPTASASTIRPASRVSLARNRRGVLPRHEAAAQHRARPGRHPFLGAAQLHLPLRRAHRGHRSGSRHRRHRDQALRRGRRLRQHHQSAASSTARCTAAWCKASARRSGSRPSTTTTASSSPAS